MTYPVFCTVGTVSNKIFWSNSSVQSVVITILINVMFYLLQNKNYNIAVVQAGFWCACGSGETYKKYGAASNCVTPCIGLKSQTCGGGWANNVMRFGAAKPVAPVVQGDHIHCIILS